MRATREPVSEATAAGDPGPGAGDVAVRLAAQRAFQLSEEGRRATPWVPVVFAIGVAVGVLGLVPAGAAASERGGPTLGLFVYGAATLLFAWGVLLWLCAPLSVRPRVVPCFARAVGPPGGPALAAFRRGRGLYLDFAALDRLADALGARPLSEFGFADDHYGQSPRWHPAAEGLATVEALRQGLSRAPAMRPEVAADLDALARALREAEGQGIAFDLRLRLRASDSLQSVAVSESRRGSFW